MLSREWMNMCLCKEQWVNSNRSVAYKRMRREGLVTVSMCRRCCYKKDVD